MPSSVKNKADFKGLLLQRRYRPGQKYLLLLFRTEAGLRFGLCRNIALVRSMQIGHTYHVRGIEHTIGHKTFLDLVSAVEVTPKGMLFRRRIGVFASAASVLLIAGTVGAGLVMSHSSARNSQSKTSADAQVQKEQGGVTPNAADKLNSILNQKKSGDSAGGSTDKATSTAKPMTGANVGDTSPRSSAPAPAPAPAPSPQPAPAPTPAPTPDPTPPPTPDPTPPPPDPTPPPPDPVAPPPSPPPTVTE